MTAPNGSGAPLVMVDIELLKPKIACARSAEGMRTFTLYRGGDESGVSGTGVVLEGVVFACGKCVVHWLTPAPTGSIAIFDNFEQFLGIHVTTHPTNGHIITYGDGEQRRF